MIMADMMKTTTSTEIMTAQQNQGMQHYIYCTNWCTIVHTVIIMVAIGLVSFAGSIPEVYTICMHIKFVLCICSNSMILIGLAVQHLYGHADCLSTIYLTPLATAIFTIPLHAYTLIWYESIQAATKLCGVISSEKEYQAEVKLSV